MKAAILILTGFVSLNVFAAISPQDIVELKQLSGQNFRNKLSKYLEEDQRRLSYDQAREVIFSKVDNDEGEVCCVYAHHHCVRTNRAPNHTVMNVEHTWPQSLGARGNAKSDMHHLFPTQSHVNSRRSSFPFCEVGEIRWEEDGSATGYSDNGTFCFEPPDEHKGNVARALFYFAVRYDLDIEPEEEEFLRRWHVQDPVDQAELDRNTRIKNHQGNNNLFILYPELADKIQNF